MKRVLRLRKTSSLSTEYASIIDILADKNLAKLGDAYVNFTFSVGQSYRTGKAANIRVSTRILSESLKRSGLRSFLPKRTPLHDQADAVEALVIYSWLLKVMSIEECISLLSETEKDDAELFTRLIKEIIGRLRFDAGEVQGD